MKSNLMRLLNLLSRFVYVSLAFYYNLASSFKVAATRFVINKGFVINYLGGKKFVFCFGNPVLQIW